jgi:hypothetical protein
VSCPDGLTVRSGASAPLNTYSVGLLTTPEETSVGVATGVGRISYHLNSVRFPAPLTLWPVQTTSLLILGSIAATACSRRPSSGSSLRSEPF